MAYLEDVSSISFRYKDVFGLAQDRIPLSQPGSCDNYLLAFLCGLDYTDNIIEFIPEKAGQYTYSCWMGTLRNTITVLEDE